MFKFVILAAVAAVALADSGERQQAPLTVVYGDAPAPAYRKSAPVYVAKARSYGSNERDDAKYSFAYKVRAGGAGGYGGADSSEEGGYGNKGYGKTAEFGHAETRDYGKTNGKYFVELPDGRLQTVEYYVNGDSGYIAKVTYSGAEKKY